MFIQTVLLGSVPSASRFNQYEPFNHSNSAMLAACISPLLAHNVSQQTWGVGNNGDTLRRTCNLPSGRWGRYTFHSRSSCMG